MDWIRHHSIWFTFKGRTLKGKAILVQAREVLRLPGGRASQISKKSAQEGGKAVSPTH